MISSTIKDLIKAVIAKTEIKKVIWGKTSRLNEFKLALDKGAITTDKWDDQNREFIDLNIYNVLGDQIDSYAVERLISEKGDDDFALLLELHNSAKREFYKVDETINGLFEELSNDKKIGKREIDDVPGFPY